MVGGAAGTAVSFASVGTEVEEDLIFTFNDTWIDEHCEVVVWIQDESNKKVLHCDASMLLELESPEPTFLAVFHADEADLCEPGLVHFYEDCIGDPISYKWIFEGGTCADPYVPNPSVYYSELGSYDVTLIVSDGIQKDTSIMEKYITVHGYPEVDFAEVQPLCNEDWDPYELTEASPAGGIYSGDYVTEGMYFHPTESGVGDYDVMYTYTDAWGCEGSGDQTVTVVNCVGLDENAANIALEVYPNPTKGIFSVDVNADQIHTADLKVIDVLGKVVFEQKELNINGSHQSSIDLSNNPEGIYFVVVSSEDLSTVKKIFLQK